MMGRIQSWDPDDCEEISNNNDEGTLGKDNIFFTLVSTRGFDEYTCTLQNRDSGTVITTFDCFISNTVAEADFPNLEDGDYTFTVTALRTISDNNPLTPDTVEEAASPPFNFRVGIGGDGGGGGGSDFDVGEQGQDVPQIAANAGTAENGFPRLNPIWRACDPNDIGAKDVVVQNGLVGMKYTAQGKVEFKDFISQLNKFNTNDFVLEVKVNFLSGVLVAELFPTVRGIEAIKTQESLYKLDPLLVTNEQTPKDGTNAPNTSTIWTRIGRN